MKILLSALVLLAAPGVVLAQTAPLSDPFSKTAPAVAADPARAATAERLLRAQIAGLHGGTPVYGAMTARVAEGVKTQAEAIVPIIKNFGTLKSVQHKGVENGAEAFLVTFDKAVTQWIVGVDEAGRITALLFRPAAGVPTP